MGRSFRACIRFTPRTGPAVCVKTAHMQQMCVDGDAPPGGIGFARANAAVSGLVVQAVHPPAIEAAPYRRTQRTKYRQMGRGFCARFRFAPRASPAACVQTARRQLVCVDRDAPPGGISSPEQTPQYQDWWRRQRAHLRSRLHSTGGGRA